MNIFFHILFYLLSVMTFFSDDREKPNSIQTPRTHDRAHYGYFSIVGASRVGPDADKLGIESFVKAALQGCLTVRFCNQTRKALAGSTPLLRPQRLIDFIAGYAICEPQNC